MEDSGQDHQSRIQKKEKVVPEEDILYNTVTINLIVRADEVGVNGPKK